MKSYSSILRKKTKILILSFYAPPDLSAGSFRIGSLLDAATAFDDSIEIDCLSTMPNRYHNYETSAQSISRNRNVTIRRAKLPKHKNGFLGLIRAYIAYVQFVARYLGKKNKDYDLIFATSSRLMTAALGAFYSRRLNRPLYLDIRDLFTDTAKDVFESHIIDLVLPLFRQLEIWAFRRASKINVVSEGFIDFVHKLTPQTPIGFIPNGVDKQFLVPVPFSPPAEKMRILYVGNIGKGQGLERSLPQAAKKLNDIAEFRIVGGGGQRNALEAALKDQEVCNVQLEPPISRDRLNSLYMECDILFLQLNRYPAFEKVLPSKLFEYAATNKPIIASVPGYAAQFVNDQINNSIVVQPCDVQGIQSAVCAARSIAEQPIDRQEFVKKYDRKRLSSELLADALSCARKTSLNGNPNLGGSNTVGKSN